MLFSVVLLFVTDVSGQPIGSIFKDQAVQACWTAEDLKMGPTGCPRQSVTNY